MSIQGLLVYAHVELLQLKYDARTLERRWLVPSIDSQIRDFVLSFVLVLLFLFN